MIEDKPLSLKIECLDCGHVENQAIIDRGEADDIRESWVASPKLCQQCSSWAIQSGVRDKMKQAKPLQLTRPSRPADYGTPTGINIPAAIIASIGLLGCVALVWAVLL